MVEFNTLILEKAKHKYNLEIKPAPGGNPAKENSSTKNAALRKGEFAKISA